MWDYLTIFIFLRVMWHVHNGSISRNKTYLILAPNFHLSGGRGYMAQSDWEMIHVLNRFNLSCSSKELQWTSVDVWRHLKHSIKIEQQTLHDDLTACKYMASSRHSILFRQTQLNDDDSHPSVSYEPLIEVEIPNLTAMPKFCLFILSLSLSSTKNIFFGVSILESLDFSLF